VSIKRIVIDASAALKWQLRDEEAVAQADAVVEDFLAERLELIVPTLFDYEITNALKVAINKKRLSEQEATKSIAWFRGLEIPYFTRNMEMDSSG
jgi:predicted nucleic acid-binding protein